MKATELMIGDWVRGTIDPDEVWQWELEDYVEIDASEVVPIPLTAEILEKNGFWWGLRTDIEDLMSMGVGVSATAEKSWVWENEGRGWVTLTFPNDSDGGEVQCLNDAKYTCYGWLDSIYIHELQHALKLCGLNELADNFKI